MSGFNIRPAWETWKETEEMDPIGFALSVYPAVVLALQELKTGYRHCQNWARYRQRFESRINDLAFHRIAFQELIFILLCSGHDPYLAQTDEAGDDFVELVRCDKSPQLKRHLEMRLGNKYDPFMYKVSRICELLEWLSKDLEEINKVCSRHFVLGLSTEFIEGQY